MDFTQYWQAADSITKTLFFSLVSLSLFSWIIGIVRVIHSHKLTTTIADDLRRTLNKKPATWQNLPFEQRQALLEQSLIQHINRYRFTSEKGLGLLGTVVAIAPFIGLFGTVWGIFHALHGIATSGQAGLAQVVAPIGESLIMTGLGLAVAIPAVIFYNLAVRLNRKAMHLAHDTAHQLLTDTLSNSLTLT